MRLLERFVVHLEKKWRDYIDFDVSALPMNIQIP